MFSRKIGAEGSVLQELCLFVILIIRCVITDSNTCEIGFCCITLIAFVRFCSKLHHTLTIRQCPLKGQITRVMPFCNSYNEILYYD